MCHYVSNQKPHVENINKQIRNFFPKGKSTDSNIKKFFKNNNITLLNTSIKSLDGKPKDAVITVYGEDLYNKIFDIVINVKIKTDKNVKVKSW